MGVEAREIGQSHRKYYNHEDSKALLQESEEVSMNDCRSAGDVDWNEGQVT